MLAVGELDAWVQLEIFASDVLLEGGIELGGKPVGVGPEQELHDPTTVFALERPVEGLEVLVEHLDKVMHLKTLGRVGIVMKALLENSHSR